MEVPDSLNDFFRYHRRMFRIMTGVCLAVFAALLLAGGGDVTLAGGFLAGAAARLIKFRFLDVAVVRAIAVDKRDPAATQLKSMALWMGLFVLAALVVLTLRLNVWALVAGFFLPPLVLVADTWLRPNLFARPAGGGDGDDAAAKEHGD